MVIENDAIQKLWIRFPIHIQ